ncbi:g4928 [Coccomyxa elongata]
MDFASTQSEILAFLEQAQEENLRHGQRSKGSITAFRLEKGSGPYKQWEKEPLRADDGEAASVSSNGDEDPERAPSLGPVVSRRYPHILLWANCSFITIVILGGILLGLHGRLHGAAHITLQNKMLPHDLSRPSRVQPRFPPVPAPAPYEGGLYDTLLPSPAQSPVISTQWVSALLSNKHKSQRRDASVSADAVAAASYWRKNRPETAAAELKGHSSASTPSPAEFYAWRSDMSGAQVAPSPSLYHAFQNPPALAPSLPPASVPRVKTGIPGWAHQQHPAKQGSHYSVKALGFDAFPSAEPASLSKWSPFHSVREHHVVVDPIQMTALTPEEQSALGNSFQGTDASSSNEEDLDYHRYSYP